MAPPVQSPRIAVVLEFDRAEMARRGRKGAAVTHARHDARALTEAGRTAFLARFLRDVDPDNELAPAERERRAALARQAYFRDLARRSVERRRSRAAGANATPAKEVA